RAIVVVEHCDSGSSESMRFQLADEAIPLSARCASDGSIVARVEDRGRVFFWNLTDRKHLATISCGKHHAVRQLAISDDGKYIAAPASEGEIGVWGISDALNRARITAD